MIIYPGSFDTRRELAIEVDGKHSHPLDLTDEELMKDLEKRGGRREERLALREDERKWKKRKTRASNQSLVAVYDDKGELS